MTYSNDIDAQAGSRKDRGGFVQQWVGGASLGWSARRRIMAILRSSCMVLGISRKSRALGSLGHGTAARLHGALG